MTYVILSCLDIFFLFSGGSYTDHLLKFLIIMLKKKSKKKKKHKIVNIFLPTNFCCMLLYVHSSIAIILMGKRELIALLNLFSWCLVMVERFFLAVPRGCLQFVIVVFPDHTHLLFLTCFGCSKEPSH